MDKATKFTLREAYEALGKDLGLTYNQLYQRFANLRKTGKLPAGTTVDALTYEQIKLILFYRKQDRNQVRPDAVAVLRAQLKTDALL